MAEAEKTVLLCRDKGHKNNTDAVSVSKLRRVAVHRSDNDSANHH